MVGGFAAAALAASVSACGGAHTAGPLPQTPTSPQKTSQSASVSQPNGIPGHWKLILDSEFDHGTYSRRLWRPGWFGTGTTAPINSEENACYSSQNVVPGSHALHLNLTGNSSRCRDLKEPYTGAVISTNPADGRHRGGFSYRYGVLQARIFLPSFTSEPSDWPAVVTFGQRWPRDGEDDIIEVFDSLACFHFHSSDYALHGYPGGCDSHLRSGWHTVAADWEPGRVTYYYDGAMVGAVTTGVTSAPMYIVLVNTVARGGSLIAQPNSMSVAYVKVWQRAN